MNLIFGALKLGVAFRDLGVKDDVAAYEAVFRALDMPSPSTPILSQFSHTVTRILTSPAAAADTPSQVRGCLKLGVALKELGVPLTVQTYEKVLSALNVATPPREFLAELHQSYISQLVLNAEKTAASAHAAPVPVVVQAPKEQAPVKVAPKVSAADLFDF